MYTHLVFDIDGTLIDTEKAIISSLKKTLKEFLGKDFADEELFFALGIPGRDALKRLGITEPEKVFPVWDQYYIANFSEVRVFDGILPLLGQLREYPFHLGVVTSKTRHEYNSDFVRLGLDAYFPINICIEDTALHKPHPEPLLEYMKRANCSPEDCIYIGDSIYDSQCAAAANIDFGLALWGSRSADQIKTSRYQFKSPSAIGEMLSL